MSYRTEIIKRIDKAKDLPTLPTVFVKMREVLNSPTSSAENVAAVLKDDIALTSKILKVANSVAFAGQEPISSVSFAISRMGFRQAGNIALSLSVMNLFGSGTGRVNYAEFWRHSICVAYTMSLVREATSKLSQHPKAEFTAGLLHDVGLFVLDQYAGDLYDHVLSTVTDKGVSLHQAEKEIMGIDHAEIGAYMLKKWNLAAEVIDGVAKHHTIPSPVDQWIKTEEVVFLSNVACKTEGISNGFDSILHEEEKSVWLHYDVADEKLTKLAEKVHKRSEQTQALLSASQSA